ncbi:MAG: hypothetical protein HZB24_04460 [Desulfobacterales bacterium]|nr:hypothetical protein [Desulfobacterales bacterium]
MDVLIDQTNLVEPAVTHQSIETRFFDDVAHGPKGIGQKPWPKIDSAEFAF